MNKNDLEKMYEEKMAALKDECNSAMQEREILEKQHELAVKYNADTTNTPLQEVWDMVLMGDTIDDLTDEEIMGSTQALIWAAIY